MTVPPAPAPPAQFTYLPGAWLAFVHDDVLLLAELSAGAPLAAACWDRMSQGGGVDAVLGAIAEEGLRAVPNFALVGPAPDGGTRVVVSGKAQVEVAAPGRSEPITISAAESTTWQEQRLPGRPGIRLVAETGDVHATSALPVIGGIVPASVLAAGVPAVAAPTPAMPAPLAPLAPLAPVPAEPAAVPAADPAPADVTPPVPEPVADAPVTPTPTPTPVPPPVAPVPVPVVAAPVAPVPVPPVPVASLTVPPVPEAPAAEPQPPERPASFDTMPPRPDFDTGLIDSLPWRTPEAFLGESGQAAPAHEPAPPAEPAPAASAWDEPGWPRSGTQQPWPDGAQNPWGDPGGQAPWPQVEPHQAPWPQVEQQPWAPPAIETAPELAPQSPPAAPTSAWPSTGWPQTGTPGRPAVAQPSQPAGQQPGFQQPAAAQPPTNPWAPGPPVPAGAGATAAPAAGDEGPRDDQVAPVVHAVLCPRRHLNPPYASSCRVCDEPIAPQEPFSALRPTLGVLTLSTGDTVPLDRDVVLGRAPFHADDNPASRPHLVQLASPGNDISRSHVRVSLENWFVQVTDLGSTNGTVVALPGQAPVRLRPHDPFTILPGTTVTIADEVTVRFEVPA